MYLKENHVKEQTQYSLDKLIEELKSKWESEKYFYDEEEARKFYKFITKLELDKGKKGQKIQPLKIQFIHTSEIFLDRKVVYMRDIKEKSLKKIVDELGYSYDCIGEISSRNKRATSTPQTGRN